MDCKIELGAEFDLPLHWKSILGVDNQVKTS